MENSELTIKKGYKQTEVGIIPEDWNVSTVGREFEIKLGKMLDAEKNVGTLKPYLGNKSVQWNRIDLNESQMMAMTQADLKRFRLRHGDLLVCEGGEVGRAAIWESPIDECYYQKALHRLRPLRKFNTKLFLEFLHYWTDHEMLGNYVSQTSIAHLTREKFAEVPLPVPPLPEQQAIAEVLSNVDALITSLDQLISKKRNIKQGTMQLLLTGKKRLPGFHGDWGKHQLIKFLEMPVTYGIVTAGEFQDHGVLMMRGGDIKNGRINTDEVPFVTVEKNKEYSRTILKRNDVVIALVGYPGESAVVPEYFKGANISRAVGLIRLNSKIDSNFLVQFLNSPMGRKIVLAPSAGSAQVVVNLHEMNKLLINVPTIEEQKAIAQILSEMDAEIEALETQRDKYKAVKQGMMQELLTGKTRLVN